MVEQSSRPVKRDPPVEMRGIRQCCLYTTFEPTQPKKQFYSGTPPYPESGDVGHIFVD